MSALRRALTWPMALPAACVVLGLVLLSSCDKPLTQTQAEGRNLYEIHCYECHDENDLDLKKQPPKLHRLFEESTLPDGTTPATDDAVRQVIRYGKRTMPAFNQRLSDEQMTEIIAYLHTQ